jgi:hypothetical protein
MKTNRRMNDKSSIKPKSEITIDDIREQKEQILKSIRKDKVAIGNRWNEMFTPREATTKGEKIIAMVDNAFAIYDGAMLGLKLIRRFRGMFRR